jgi:hypothetical protein
LDPPQSSLSSKTSAVSARYSHILTHSHTHTHIQFLFGSCEYWDPDYFDLTGGDDLVSLFFSKKQDSTLVDARIHMTGGFKQVYLEPDVRDRVDKLLGHLESSEGVAGNGTMLLLGESCLFSRFSLHETRMVHQLPSKINTKRYCIITMHDRSGTHS